MQPWRRCSTRRLHDVCKQARQQAPGRTGRPPPLRLPAQPAPVDGGKGQLGVAERVVRELGLEDEIELAALAKQFEEVYRPGSPDPVRLRRGSDALYLLQRVRDEAHRFAITFHRERRAKRMTRQHPRRHPRPRSGPQGPPGQGAAAGCDAVRAATLEELQSLLLAARRASVSPSTRRAARQWLVGRKTGGR